MCFDNKGWSVPGFRPMALSPQCLASTNFFLGNVLKMAKITIDDVDYDTESLSPEALAQLQSIQFVDAEVAQLSARIAAMNTARNAYATALQELLPQEQEGPSPTAS